MRAMNQYCTTSMVVYKDDVYPQAKSSEDKANKGIIHLDSMDGYQRIYIITIES